MKSDDLEKLCEEIGMIRTCEGLKNPFWTASIGQIQKLVDMVVLEVKQSASEMMINAIKKTAEYERKECAKLADYAGSAEAAKAIREREND